MIRAAAYVPAKYPTHGTYDNGFRPANAGPRTRVISRNLARRVLSFYTPQVPGPGSQVSVALLLFAIPLFLAAGASSRFP
jgi:hypothetical protein